MRFLTFSLVLFLFSCTQAKNSSIEIHDLSVWYNEPLQYRVQENETIHLIAWKVGVDFRKLVFWNNLKEPYSLKTGQVLNLSGGKKNATVTDLSNQKRALAEKSKPALAVEKTNAVVFPVPDFLKAETLSSSSLNPTKPKTTVAKKPVINKSQSHSSKSVAKSRAKTTKQPSKKTQKKTTKTTWQWPVKGKVVTAWESQESGRGIEIVSGKGEAVRSTSDGKVVYAGDDLPGFGGMIIVKHDDSWLSAYAYNSQILVAEGKQVKQGQKIAVVGQDVNGRTILHFEIRHNGKPVDPQQYLPKR